MALVLRVLILNSDVVGRRWRLEDARLQIIGRALFEDDESSVVGPEKLALSRSWLCNVRAGHVCALHEDWLVARGYRTCAGSAGTSGEKQQTGEWNDVSHGGLTV